MSDNVIDKEDIGHLIISGILFVGSTTSLYYDYYLEVSILVILVLCAYLSALILECARLSKGSKSTACRMPLPNRTWVLLIVVLLVVTDIVAFANIYHKSEGITYEENKEIKTMSSKMDSIYFSTVTVTTLGYGDFTPTQVARKYVIFQLASGMLLLFFIVPVVAARISSWESPT